MPQPHDEATVREQAYYLWEADGRPHGRETEYWMRAKVALAAKPDLDMVTKPAPKRVAKPKAAATDKPAGKSRAAGKAGPALKASGKAAAGRTKVVPAKAEAATPAKKARKK